MKWQIFKGGLILEENTQGSLENRESKMEFFTKHSQVNIFLIETFSGFDL